MVFLFFKSYDIIQHIVARVSVKIELITNIFYFQGGFFINGACKDEQG